jgi:hypothetical protein
MIQVANSLIDVVMQNNLEMLDSEHIEILLKSCTNKNELESSAMQEAWLKVYQKLKNYLLVSICDQVICQEALVILHSFLTAD